MERDRKKAEIKAAEDISTHTLTWSVTYLRLPPVFQNGISTHTLTWSVTKDFEKLWNDAEISTHTLTWSVTPDDGHAIDVRGHFNSHAHVERD
mgnify:CR=1 FL=1